MENNKKWSIFNYTFRYKENTLIRNTLNESLVKLENKKYDQIDDYFKGEMFSVSDEINDVINDLTNQGIIVSKDIDEKANYFENLLIDYQNDDLLALTIAVTYNCNFNCTYCYESGIDRRKKFDNSVLENTIHFLKNYLTINQKISRVHLFLFGGEPTLNWAYCEQLLEKLDTLFKEKNIEYKTSITTNGFLLDESKSKFLSKFNWRSAEITLDGPSSIHDKRRMLIDGGKTFDSIWKNVCYILDNNLLPRINLRINLSYDNYLYLADLLDFILSKYNPDRFLISTGIVTDTVKESSAHKHIENIKFDESEWPKIYKEIYKTVSLKGFEQNEFYMVDGYCLAKERHSMILAPDGKIYKCLSMIGRNECAVGKMDKNPTDLPSYLYKEMLEECFNKKCPLVPMCMSGCLFMSFLIYNNIKKVYCRRKEYDEINRFIGEVLYGN